MKKILGFALILSLAFSVAACRKTGRNGLGTDESTETSSPDAVMESTQETEPAPDGTDGSSSISTEKEKVMKAEFDFETKTVMLNSGYKMPINGLGTYSLHGDECVGAVKTALSNGVRLIDTASAYSNDVICCEL